MIPRPRDFQGIVQADAVFSDPFLNRSSVSFVNSRLGAEAAGPDSGCAESGASVCAPGPCSAGDSPEEAMCRS